MASKIGSLTVADLLEERFASPVKYGVDKIVEVLNADLAAWNIVMGDMVSPYCEITSDRQRISGSVDALEMEDLDEFGRARTHKARTGATVGFPMRAAGIATGWTKKWLRSRTVRDVAEQFVNIQTAHRRRVIRDVKRAIFGATNYTFTDNLVAPIHDLSVKRFCNADGDPIPSGPRGGTFNGSTHQHYTAAASLAAADVKAAINTVLEHDHAAGLVVHIASADETAFRALSGFTKLEDPRVILGTEANKAAERLDLSILDDRPIGYFESAVVWVKPWMLPNYLWVTAIGDRRKPLALRTFDGGPPSLELAAQYEGHPFAASQYETEFGVGVWTRTNGAVHQFNNGTYQSPTIS